MLKIMTFTFFYILPFWENKTVTFKPHGRKTRYPKYEKKKSLVKQFLVKMVCVFHHKLGFRKEILFLQINKKAAFLAALCVSSYLRCDQAWLPLDTSLLLDVKHHLSYSVEKRCLQRVI